MSRGSKVVHVRLDDARLKAVQSAIDSANHHTRDVPYDLSAWIRQAIDDKLAHLVRSRRPRTSAKAERIMVSLEDGPIEKVSGAMNSQSADLDVE